jgi:hypothetical protein
MGIVRFSVQYLLHANLISHILIISHFVVYLYIELELFLDNFTQV